MTNILSIFLSIIIALHAGLGGAIGAVKGDALAGAVGAVAGEAFANNFGDPSDKNQTLALAR
jgi:outer membrane lipoprotein SlyB